MTPSEVALHIRPSFPVFAPSTSFHYPHDINLYSAAVLNNDEWFHKILRPTHPKIFEMRKQRIKVTRPFVIFRPSMTLQRSGFNTHIVACISNFLHTPQCPSGQFDFKSICSLTTQGKDVGFDTPEDLHTYFCDNKLTHVHLYPISHAAKIHVIWSQNKAFTAQYNQIFLTPSYLPKEAASHPCPFLFWFPDCTPGLKFIPCLHTSDASDPVFAHRASTTPSFFQFISHSSTAKQPPTTLN